MNDADLKKIVNSVGFGIIELDNSLNVSFCNKTWSEISGYDADECKGKSISDFLTSGSVSIFENALHSAKSHHSYQSLWFINKKNEVFPLSFIINRGVDNRSWILELHDRGKQKGIDSKIADLYYEVDKKGKIKIISSDVDRKLHYKPDQCLQKHYSFLYENPVEKTKNNDAALELTHFHNQKDYMVNKNGEKVYVVESIEKISTENGDYNGFSCVVKFYDISEKELSLFKEYNDRYIKFWDLTNEGLILHKGGLVLDVNERIEKILGYPKKDLVGGYFIDLAVKDEWKEVVLTKIINEDPGPYEVEGVRKNGEVFPVELESRNFLFEGEEVRITAVRDLTDKRNEGKLVDKEKILDVLEQSTDRKTGYKYFESVILNISGLLKADMVFIGRFDKSKTNVHTLATCTSGVLADNISYSLKETPCEEVVRKSICSYSDEAYKLFPKDKYLQKEKYRGYVGVELKDSHGESIGILVTLFKRKILNLEFTETVSRVFSQRLESEMERTLIEEELKRSTDMLKLILNNIPVNVYWKDKDLNYQGGNQSFLHDAGFRNDNEIIGKTDQDMPWKEEAEIYAISDRSVLKKGVPQLNEEEPQTLLNGAVRWIKTSKVPMKNKEGETIGLLGISEDITEKKLIESSIKESENRFRNLAENIPGIIYSCEFNHNSTFIYLNENIKDITGYTKSQFTEEHISLKELIHPDDFPFVYDQKKMAVNTRTAYQVQFRIKHKDGSWRWVEESGIGVYEKDELLHLEGVMMDVTSRVEAEKIIKENEVKLRLLIENLNGVFWIMDLKSGKIEYISPQYEEIWGRPVSKMYRNPKDFMNDLHPEDKERVKAKFENMVKGEPFEDVYRVNHPDKEKTIWVSSSFYEDEKNGFSKIVGYAEDITDKVNIERTLKESETKFKTLIENLDGITYILNLSNMSMEYVSPQYEKIWGRKREDFLKDPYDFMSIIHPEDLEIITENIKKVDAGNDIKQNFRIIVDNEIKYISGKVSNLKDNQSQSKKVIGYSEDVTSSEKAKKEIEKLALVSQKTNNAIVITDKDCKIEWINMAFYKYTGYNLQDIKGQFIQHYLYGPGTSEESITRLHIAIENKLNVKVETVLNSLTGQNRWVEVNINPVFDAKGEFEKLFAVMIDITERKVNEEAIRKQNEELIKTNQELDNFVYRVSHDLKAPISSVKGLINIMKLETNPGNVNACVDRIEESMDKLDSFILDILDYSRNSRFELEPSAVDLDKEIKSVLKELRYLSHFEPIKMIAKVNGNNKFYSDKRRIKFILNNLISNAIRFSDPNKEDPAIEINVDVTKKEAIIKCSDNGIGIEEEYMERIFEMFFRATEVKAGSGLGLYIVKEAVDKLNGKIIVDSELNQGSTFTVHLPNMVNTATE